MLGMAQGQGKKAPEAVTAMVRAWIHERAKTGEKPAETARRLGVTRTQLVVLIVAET